MVPNRREDSRFMITTRKRWLYVTLGVAFGHLLIGANSLKAQGDCKVVLDAMTKLFDTPTHAYVTMNIGGKPQTGESIYAGGLVYAKYGDKWSAGTTTKEMKEIEEKNRQTNKTTESRPPWRNPGAADIFGSSSSAP
jgi:hypothetical protein